jgi:hypothetical protein
MVTFTLPEQLRSLARRHSKVIFNLLMQSAWETLSTFARNLKTTPGEIGAVAVLHTNNRRLDFHPHVHCIVPAGVMTPGVQGKPKQWQALGKKGYLFNGKALGKVFRGIFLRCLSESGLTPSIALPKHWVAHCKHVGRGEKALEYLGRYLYRGVLPEANIIESTPGGLVKFRYIDSATQTKHVRSLTGVAFLKLLLQHVLPRGFQRARNFGFLHPNAKKRLAQIHLKLKFVPQPPTPKKRPPLVCPCCQHSMIIRFTKLRPQPPAGPPGSAFFAPIR